VTRARSASRGITLIEVLLVMAIIAAIAGISFPAVSSGLDSLRLRTASSTLASFLNNAIARVERRQEPVELFIDAAGSRLELRGLRPGILEEIHLPEGVQIAQLYPASPGAGPGSPHSYFLMPGATFPALTFELANRRGVRRRVSIDPVSGAPAITDPLAAAQ
jgi:general secretion pathway protein H